MVGNYNGDSEVKKVVLQVACKHMIAQHCLDASNYAVELQRICATSCEAHGLRLRSSDAIMHFSFQIIDSVVESAT